MLEPNDRSQLYEALRPPEGFEIDCAIGTTFSLDLMAMLIAPVSFTSFDWALDGEITRDPLALLESVRRNARKIAVFCHAGRIAAPAKAHPLFAYLEDSIVEVRAELKGGVFHPKVWALRFSSPDQGIRYRFLCLTRNLTFDRCWDTALTLEGQFRDDLKAGFARNRPLVDFVTRLPHLALRGPSDRARQITETIASEIQRVEFEPPAPLDLVAFRPMGIEGYQNTAPITDKVRRLLVVAPFVTPGFLGRFTDSIDREPNVLVSRVDTLASIPPDGFGAFKSIYALSLQAEPELADEPEGQVESQGQTCLTGLHAKLFAADDGWTSTIWTGSANATESAFKENVEFLVELSGKKSVCGIDSLLSSSDTEVGFGNLLQPFEPGPQPDEELLERQRLVRELDRIRDEIVTGGPNLTASLDEHGTYSVRLGWMNAVDPDSLQITAATVRLATLPHAWAQPLSPENVTNISWQRIAVESLTRFVAFELRITEKGISESIRFALNVPLDGAPADREHRVMRSMLANKSDVLRLLLMILSEGDASSAIGFLMQQQSASSSGSTGSSIDSVPLLESLVRALGRNPQALDRLDRLVADLNSTDEGRELLPERFNEIWEPIMSARKELAK